MREFLYFIKESAAGVPVTSPTLGTDAFYLELGQDTAFAGSADPQFATIMAGGGLATMAQAVSDVYESKFALKTRLYPAQAALLFGWAGIPFDGSTTPWATTEPAGDLVSASFFHVYYDGLGNQAVEQYSYSKCSDLALEVSRDSKYASLTLGGTAGAVLPNAMDGSSAPSAPTAPTYAQLPTGPYMFNHTAGNLILRSTGSAVRTNYDSLSLKITNALDPRPFESTHATVIRYCGRNVTLDASLFLKNTPDDKSAYQAITAQTCSLTFNNGTHTLAINFEGNNHLAKRQKEMPLNKVYMQQLTIQNKLSATAGTDLAITTS